MTAFVALDNVSHVYGGASGGTLAVDGLSVRVNRGEFAAVVGPSGCGKSTLMKLATGLQFPVKGTVQVAGARVSQPVKIAGMAFQAPTLLPWRTTLENLLLPLEIVEPHRSRLSRHKAEYVARAKSLLDSVGLHDQGDKYPWQLSGGMQQRTSLCRALIHEPDLLMLDEPFGALDMFTREELWLAMQDIWLARKPTVVLVTHDLREAVFLADRIFVMSARPGRMIAERKVELPRPRALSMTYDPYTVGLVQELRDHISAARVAA